MAPSSNDRGLRVSKIDIAALENAGSFRYSIMLTQVADNSSYISGLAAVNFVGLRNGERVILPLRDLDSSVTDLGVKFRFRYFQEISGELQLPEQFVPEQVQVVLQSNGRQGTACRTNHRLAPVRRGFMFSSKDKGANTHYDTLISVKTEIVGDVKFTGGLHVDGVIKGNLVAEPGSGAVVRISDKGRVLKGQITAPNVIVNGRVIGDVHAR